MNIKIITDSTADLPLELAERSGITVIPAYLKLGEVIYRDRISFTDEEFYEKMLGATRVGIRQIQGGLCGFHPNYPTIPYGVSPAT